MAQENCSLSSQEDDDDYEEVRMLGACFSVCPKDLKRGKRMPIDCEPKLVYEAIRLAFQQYFPSLRPSLDHTPVDFIHDIITRSEQYGSNNSRTKTRSYVLVDDENHKSRLRNAHPLIFGPDADFLIPATVLSYIRVSALDHDLGKYDVILALLRFYAPHIDRLQHAFAEAAEIWSSRFDFLPDRTTLFAIPTDRLAGKFVQGIFDEEFQFEPLSSRIRNDNFKQYRTNPKFDERHYKFEMAVLRLPPTPVENDQDID